MHIKAFLLANLLISVVNLSLFNRAQAAMIDKISAVVNNEVVLLSDVERFERTLELRKELDPLFGLSEDVSHGSPARTKILDFLIQERLVTQTFKVSDQDVETEVQSVQRGNNLTRDQLIEFLKHRGFDFSSYFELMRVGLAKRNLLDREIRTRVNISDDDVKNYYYNMAVKNESIPLEYSIQLIVVSNESYKTPAAARETAERALRSIKQGESFAEIAKRFSDDPSSGQGGELGYFSPEQLSEPIRSAVRKLQINQSSDLLTTKDAHIIVKLLDARSSQSERFLTAKEQIREQLAKEEYKKQLIIWAERARNNAYVHINAG